MSKKKRLVPTERQQKQIDQTWQRYRRLVTGLRGLWGEVLAIHLTIEGELDERLRAIIPHPDQLLEKYGFEQKLSLLMALWPGTALPTGEQIRQIKRLNAIRNMIAHGDTDEEIAKSVHELLCQASPQYRQSPKSHDDAVDGLRSVAMSLCGFIVGLTDGESFEKLRRLTIEKASS